MFKRFLRFGLAIIAAAAVSTASAADLPKPIADAAPHLNSFAATGGVTTINGPLGGSYSVDVSGWAGSSGTINIAYNNFRIGVLGQTWTYNGNWVYTGSIQNNGWLNGSLTGTWAIGGLNFPNMGISAGSTMSIGFNIQFSNGMANGSLSVTLPGYGAYSVPVNFSQSQALGMLL